MLALRRLAAAHETRPLATALAAQIPASSHNQSSSSSGSSALHLCSARPSQHQRRQSSSKPSSPPNDGAIAPPGAAAPAAAKESTGAAKKRAPRSPRTKERYGTKSAADGSSASAAVQGRDAEKSSSQALPSVASTAHMDSQDVSLASFFSLHRPISVTVPVPRTATPSSFAAIFQAGSRHHEQHQQNMRVQLEWITNGSQPQQHPAQHQQHPRLNPEDLRRAVTQASSTNADESSEAMPVVFMSLEELAQGMQPFNPPPPPQPFDGFAQQSLESLGDAAQAEQAVHLLEQALQSSSLKDQAIWELRARSKTLATLIRARRRQFLASLQVQPPTVWRTISTRRQRKLKMKKHKFKKLSKRLRNEKRRLDRL